jgi:DNA-binding SARP family transcriptional activator
MSRSGSVRLELLGGFHVLVNGRAVGRALTVRQQQILTYLVLHARGPVARAEVAGQLWPESTDAQASTNLRREWHHLREAWPELDGRVETTARVLTWRDPAPDSDVAEFEAAAKRARSGDLAALDEAATLYRGDLLPGCADEWIQADRARLRATAIELLGALVARLEKERALADAITRAQQLLRFDPLNEPAWCALMRCHARRGERATALHLYQECAATLKRELDVQPSPATRRTYREILDLGDEAPDAPVAAPPVAVFPLVGREAEWSNILAAHRIAESGRPHLLLIRGEAGIGKTRLAEELVDWCRRRGRAVAVTKCYSGEGRLGYAPIAAWLHSDAVAPSLGSLNPVHLREVARLRPELMSADDVTQDSSLEPWERTPFFDALSHAFEAASPLVLVADDLQWSDADSLEWLHYFLRTEAPIRCLMVATVRAGEDQDNRALGTLVSELERLERLTRITLGRLDEASTVRLAEEVAGHAFDAEARRHLFEQTEGHPLFVVEQGRSEQAGAGEGIRSPRVQAVMAARLAHLSPDARQVAEVAAAIGRDFAFDVLSDVCDLEEPAVVRALDELWRHQVVRVQAAERWDFSHDRIREVAYESLGPARRRLIHRRIAQALERLFAADLDGVSAAIAVHLDRGGQPARAIPFLERAADVAARVSASEETVRCFTYALSLVNALPSGRDRDARELAIRDALSAPLTSARGYAATEVESNLERIVALGAALGHKEVPVRWLWGLWTLHFVLGNMESARQVSEQALASSVDEASRCEAHHAMAGTLTSLGELEAARTHFTAALAAYDERAPRRSASGSDLGVFAHAWYAHDLFLLGDPDGARQEAASAIALARRLEHPYSLALALAYGALTHQLRDDVPGTLACAEEALALCDRYAFAYYDDWARVLSGWARGRQGDPRAGLPLIERGLQGLEARRARARRPYYLGLLAETLVAAGRYGPAAAAIDDGINIALSHGDRWWLPALLRQKAALQPGPSQNPAG